jgi:hypothetical protein
VPALNASVNVEPAPAPAANVMNPEFIARNQIIERYLAGRLPLRGVQDFERFCREHPQLLEQIHLSERLNAALRLLEVGGRAPPGESKPKPLWRQWSLLVAALAVAVAGLSIWMAGAKLASRDRSIVLLQQRAAAQPLEPAKYTRAVMLTPDRAGPMAHSDAIIGGGAAQLAELNIDMSWSKFAAYNVSIDRVDQGRVAVVHNLVRDSNGALRLALNSSALGPGDYQISIDGVSWRGDPVPQAWSRISIAH